MILILNAERAMNPAGPPTHDSYDTFHGAIFARIGHTLHCLALQTPNGAGKPMLADAAGTVVNPWEVELLRWPPEAETLLRRGGYLPSQPVEMELWCNCAD